MFQVSSTFGENGEFPGHDLNYTAACDDDNIYCLGVPSSLRRWLERGGSKLWKMNLKTSTWKKLEVLNIPDQIISSLGLHSNKLILQGYINSYRSGIFVCDLDERCLNFKIFERLDSPRHSLKFVEDCSYIMKNQGSSSGVFNQLTLGVSPFKDVPNPVRNNDQKLAVIGNKIFILGFFRHFINDDFKKIEFYDFKKKFRGFVETKADTKEGYPTPRRAHSVATMDNTIFIIGGVSSSHKYLKCAWKLDVEKLTWEKIPYLDLIKPLHSHTTVITPSGKMLTFGGYSDEGKLFEFTEILWAWLTVPKLCLKAWDCPSHTCGPICTF